MNKFKIFFLSRILSVHKGFSTYREYSISKKNYFLRIKYFFINFNLNKYFIINFLFDIFSEIFFLITFLIFFPVVIYFRLKKLRIAVIDTLSIGDFYIDLSLIINDRSFKANEKKIILLVPKESPVYEVSHKVLKNIFIVKSNFFICFLLYSISYFNSKIQFRTGQYSIYKNIKFYIFPKNMVGGGYKQLKNFIIVQKKINENNFILPKKIKNILKKSLNENLKNFSLPKKIIVLNLRELVRNDKHRNSKNYNYHLLIKDILKKGYLIYYFYEKKNQFKNFSNSKNFYSINLKNNKILQFFIYFMSDIYVGTLNGPFHLSQFLNKKSLCIDVIDFNCSIIFKKIKIVPKKLYNKKTKKVFSYREVHAQNLENNHNDSKIKVEKVKVLLSSPKQIIDAYQDITLNSKFNLKKFKYRKDSILNYVSNKFYIDNKSLFN